jgi:hypothetical protein
VFAGDGHKDEPDSSDDEDDRLEDEFITSFNNFGAQRWCASFRFFPTFLQLTKGPFPTHII